MASPCIPHLIMLLGLTGIHGQIVTVSEVSVKTGDSVSIPCSYKPLYRENDKYLCKGEVFWTCKIVVQTNQPKSTWGRFSIFDDTEQSIFTVSINDLTDKDTYYWCAVKIKLMRDVRKRFHLSVTTAMPSLYVDRQEMTALQGGSVTVACHYKDPDITKWCNLDMICVTDQTGSIAGTPVTINTSVPDVFSVTMSELKTESSGWYLCAIERSQMPVHITVHKLTSTTTTTMSPTTANFTGTLSTTCQDSTPLTSTAPHTAHPTNTTIPTAGADSVQGNNKSSTNMTILTTILVLLLLAVPAAFVGWKIRHNKTTPVEPEITAGSQPGSDPEVLYAAVVHKQHAAAQSKVHMPEESVIYSTIVIKDSAQKTAEPDDGSVIYSNCAQ